MNSFALAVNVGLGLILLASYVYFGMKNNKIVNKLWGNIKGVKRKIIITSILITALFYLFTFYYISFKSDNLDKEKIKNIVLYQAILILASMLWMPLSIKYLNKKEELTKIGIILILFVVAMSALAIFYNIFKLNDSGKYKNLALIGSGLLFLHTFLLDFLDWNYNFFYE
tara:strand:+ start:92 stop:601 length:510 start_codon:yes stop_codon:yes gene_type:complete